MTEVETSAPNSLSSRFQIVKAQYHSKPAGREGKFRFSPSGSHAAPGCRSGDMPASSFAGLYRWKQGFFPFLIAIVFLLIHVGVSRSIFRPLEKIEEGVRHLSEGNFNWKIRFRDTQTELGSMSGRLNQMAESVRDKTQKLSNSLAESQALLGGMEEGVLILDLQGRVKKMNASMLAIIPQSFPADLGNHYLPLNTHPMGEGSK